jgi:FkbM family methyltransferase
MGSLLRPGDLVFDVGAHVGNKANVFLAQGARVVCVEPQPRCIAALRHRFGKHDRVTIVAGGLGACAGNLTLSICSHADTISTFNEDWKKGRFAGHVWDKQVDVDVTTLDLLVEKYGQPHYCKIDVEGFELEILRGLSRPIRFLSFEYAIEFVSVTTGCVQRLVDLGYRRFNVSRGESARLALTEWVSAEGLLSWLRTETDPLAWGDVYATTDDAPTVTELPAKAGSLLRRAFKRLTDMI